MSNNIKGPFRQQNLKALILSEGYCCIHGYLKLCLARGEHPVDMAANLGRHKSAIYSNLRELKCGNRPCQQRADCLLPIITEVERLVEEEKKQNKSP